MQKEWHQAVPNLIKEEQRYINKSGSGGREMKKQRKKAKDKQRNKLRRLWQTLIVGNFPISLITN